MLFGVVLLGDYYSSHGIFYLKLQGEVSGLLD